LSATTRLRPARHAGRHLHLTYRFDRASPESGMAFSGLLIGVGFRF
jgi:hypothetical protein